MTATSSLFNPFPGLRPFHEDETHLFFGRDVQIDELLAELSRSRFVAVMGASGSGKSSLVAAGLLPALHGGLSPRLGANWRIASLRPGGDPIRNLARVLVAPNVPSGGGPDENRAVDQAEALLRRSSLGLADLARRDERLREGRLLVVVDQFEELFRFQRAGGRAVSGTDNPAFVRLLIEAAGDESPVSVILTMRSDYLGDCSQFDQLPETINQGLYLVPRLTRSQLRQTITGPVAVGGGTIAPRLVQRLLNDAGADPDLLPVLQHALMRMWDLWTGNAALAGPIDLEHYEAAGGLENALARHADEAYHDLGDDRTRRIAELAFKRLTELGTDGREGRHPATLTEIASVSDTTVEDVREVIHHFEQPGRSFVTVSNDGVVDISHESLIRQWPRLRDWVGEEADSRDTYHRLAEAAGRWRRGEAALMRDPDLQLAVNWWTDNQPSAAWAERYGSTFPNAADYLDRSRKAEKRRRVLTWSGVAGLGVIAVLFAVLAVWAIRAEDDAEYQGRLAVGRQLAAVSAEQGSEFRTSSILTALEALRTTETDELRLPEAEVALRAAMHDPLGVRLPGHPGQAGHDEDVTVLGFSPDGRWLATGSAEDTVLLWDLDDTEADPRSLPGHADDVMALAFSRDGRWLATGSLDGTAMLWDLEDPEAESRILDGHTDQVRSLAFSSDGRWLATGSFDGTIYLREMDNPDRVAHVLEPGAGFILCLAFSPDGRLLAAGTGSGVGYLWEMGNPGGAPETLSGHTDDVLALAFSRDGGSLATGSRDATVRLWDLTAPAEPVATLEQGDAVLGLALSSNGRWLATGGEDNAARLWDLQRMRGSSDPSLVLVHSAPVERVSFSGDSRWLATGGPGDPARLFQVEDPNVEPVVLAGPVTALGFSADDRWLAIGSDHGSARLWSTDQLASQPVVVGHDDEVTAISFGPNGRLATGTAGNVTRLWSLDDPGAEPEVLEQTEVAGAERAQVETIAFSPDGRLLATGSGDRQLRLWTLGPSGSQLLYEQPLDAGVNDLAFSADGDLVAIAVKDEAVLLWDVAERSFERLEGHNAEVLSVAFSPDGLRLATGSLDGEILVWNLEDLDAPRQRLNSHTERVTSMAFDGEGGRFASGSWDGNVQIWEVGTRNHVMLDAGVRVNDIALRPDGELLALAADESQLWDLTALDPTDPIANPVVLEDHTGHVSAVAFSPDGRWLGTGSEDHSVRLWLQLEELIELGCASVGRNLSQEEVQEIKPGADRVITCEEWPEGS
jgi:WD40 repeat protein/energy-coupling factor transporter ATP-binding protein EcfA2